MRLPIRTRLTLVSVGLTAIVLALAAVGLLVGFRSELERTIDEGLASRFAAYADDPTGSIERPSVSDETFVQFLPGDGSSLVTSFGLEPILPRSVTDRLAERRFSDGEIDEDGELVPVRILAGPASEGVLVVAVDVEDQREAIGRLTALVAVGGPFLLGALAFVGWVLAGGALRPVERLREEAAAISTIEPSRRLPVPETADELQRLAETLNAMLDRLNEGLERERRFVDEASHELRTPLGVLQAEVELALKEPRSRGELEAALRSVEEEANRLTRLTRDLLVLARADRGRLPVRLVETDVGDVLERVAARFADRAAAARVRLSVEADAVRGRVDPERLRQAMENLVDNALRHVRPGGEVRLEVTRETDGLRLAVRDDGPGFPSVLIERAFEPFARDDRARGDGGAGLGLAIVRAVAEAHGGRASAENAAGGGAVVAMILPG